MFCIEHLSKSEFAGRITHHVRVSMPVKVWAAFKKSRQLGQLYGIDISNSIYAMDRTVYAYNPTVDDRRNAKHGIKTISLTYSKGGY
jgi:hypothetical protein